LLREHDSQVAPSPSQEQSLSALDREAHTVAAQLAQEKDPEERLKLERYAKAIEQIRNSLH
jgi:hypothetical protein